MTVFMYGSEAESFNVLVGTPSYFTAGARHDPLASRGGLVMSVGGYFGHLLTSAISTGDFWFRSHSFLETSPVLGSLTILSVRDSAGVLVVDIFADTTDFFFRFNDGGVMTVMGDNITADANNTLALWDIRVNFDSNTISLYKNGFVLRTASNLNFSNIPNVKEVRTERNESFTQPTSSEYVVADEPTIGRRVITLSVTADGAVQNQDSGDFTDVDELVLDTVDVNTWGAVGLETTYIHSGIDASFADRLVESITTTSTVRENGGGASTDLDIGLRIGTTQFYHGTHEGIFAFTNENNTVSTNPDTSADFTQAEVNAAELAFRSA